MEAYDSRGLTLDPGLTALALRGLHEPEGHYPFLDRFTRRRTVRRTAGRRPSSAARPVWRRVLVWLGLRRRPAVAA